MSPHIATKTLDLLRSKTSSKDELQPHDYNLSERETEILKLLAKGSSYQQIANDLFISHGTVRKHVENIYNKLHINSKAQAANLAHQRKWV
jgi:DNA-binding NarL/FixJ family response regulator